MIWLVCAAFILIALGLILRPMLRRQSAADQRLGYDVAVYRDQLAEVERDQERGLLTAEQANAVKAEVQRRMLAAAEADQAEPATDAKALETGRWLRLTAAMLILLAVPGGSLALYALLGAPGLPAQPFSERQNSPEFRSAQVIETLEARLAESPDARGFALLAGAYRQVGRLDDAVAAYRKAIELGGGNPELYSSLGEVLALAQGGGVGPESRQAFLQALQLDRADPRARFYLGLSKAQIGKAAEAIAIWRDLEKDTPADAPWREMLQKQIAQAAEAAKLDANSIAPQPPSLDGAQAPVTAMPKLAGQDAMIRQMVAGLAAKLAQNPNDVDGWLRLSRSYRVLNEFEKAKDAARKAVALRPKEAAPLLALADVQLAAAQSDKLPDDVIATVRQALALEPDNMDALYYVGAAESQLGNAAKARELWGKLLAKLPEGSPERADLQKEIDSLGK